MTVSGYILDAATKKPLAGASVTITNPQGVYLGIGVAADNNGYFSVSGDQVDYPNYIVVTNIGYFMAQEQLYPEFNIDWNGTVLLNRNDKMLPPVTVTATGKNYAWLLLLAVPFIINKKKKQAVGKIGTDTVIAVGAGFLLLKGTGLLNSLLETFGVQDTSGAPQQQSDPGSPWKPVYWSNNASSSTQMSLTSRKDDFKAMAQFIYLALGEFSDDYDMIKSIFDRLTSKCEVSYLADIFSQSFSKDLLGYLQNGSGYTPLDGLSNTHMKALIDLVNKLPVQ